MKKLDEIILFFDIIVSYFCIQEESDDEESDEGESDFNPFGSDSESDAEDPWEKRGGKKGGAKKKAKPKKVVFNFSSAATSYFG